ncbi:MAG: hypothetical protein FJ293_13620 [Planctomycetes bacterium]|nr:hypothetical protein [Planctomycetota bacterium]
MAIDPTLDGKLQAAARSFASGNDGGVPLADAATLAAITAALAPTDASYADAMELIKAERSAVIERCIVEGRYTLLTAGATIEPPSTRGAVLATHKGLGDGKIASIVVKRGEAPALEEALGLSRRILDERTATALDLLRRQYRSSPSPRKQE